MITLTDKVKGKVLGDANTGFVGSISISDSESWRDKWFITLDLDWAHDDVLSYAIDLVEEAGIRATWLITHESGLLNQLRSNPLFEIGIHPNFNGLLSGEKAGLGSFPSDIIADLLRFLPEARVARSHSLAYSSRLSDTFLESGITHDLNSYIPSHATRFMSPWRLPNGQVRVPTGWEDDLEFPLKAVPDWSRWDGIRVVNFHPIHLFLNTDNSRRYEATRLLHQNPEALLKNRNKGFGTESVFASLISHIRD